MNHNKELWLSLVAMVLIAGLYTLILILTRQIPPAAGLFGHLLGILGFLLMLLTETLYTLRKKSQSARWGKMSDWLEFHIFTGLVGPFMVLLHSSWKFNGLAGAVMLMTLLIVASGFVGRYIYTAIPRTAEGVEIQADALEQLILQIDRQIVQLDSINPHSQKLLKQKRDLKNEKRKLINNVKSLGRTRKWMAIWHAIHIPLGMGLFAAAFIHITGAIYYATLLH